MINNDKSTGTNKYGLEDIFTSEQEVTKDNVVNVIKETLKSHEGNVDKILNLKKVYTGDQEILNREKEATTVSNEKFNINIIPTLVNTVAGLTLGEKVDYVLKDNESDGSSKELKSKDLVEITTELHINNDILMDKDSLVEMYICGKAYQFCAAIDDRTVLSKVKCEEAYIIRTTEVGNRELAAVVIGSIKIDKDKTLPKYTVFTQTDKYIVYDDKVQESMLHALPEIPLQEIKLNEYALSLVAQLEPLQNAMNLAVSDSINTVQNQLRALLFITGAEMDRETVENAKASGVVTVKGEDGRNITANYLQKPIDTGLADLRTHLFDMAVFISCMPQTGGTSGNGMAALIGSGYEMVNQNAYFVLLPFKKAKRGIVNNLIKILQTRGIVKSDLSVRDIDISFDRNNLADIQSTAQAMKTFQEMGVPPRNFLKLGNVFSDIEQIAKYMEKDFVNKVVEGVVSDTNSNVAQTNISTDNEQGGEDVTPTNKDKMSDM